ncbi:MAG: NUDIX domain-containing protein [Bacilli bacterium]|jgi:mutator protein MutT
MEDKDLGYLLNLRKVVGHRPLVAAFSVVVVINDNNEVLMERRADDQMLDFPGGSIELKETALAAAKRELLEETGLVCSNLTLFNVYSGELAYYKYSNGDEVYGVDIVYLTNQVSGKLKKQIEEVSSLSYYALDAIPSDSISKRNKKIISDLKDYLNKRNKR